ncbi:MAG: hypothetical protein ACRDZX_02730, partial [Acidimicrobiales bacterium]
MARKVLALLGSLQLIGASLVLGAGYRPEVAAAQGSGASPAAWAPVASSSPAGLTDNVAYGLSCPAAGTCLAVGWTAGEASQPGLVESLGTAGWQVVGTPAGPGSSHNQLDAISCWSPGSCVAVGYYADVGGPAEPLVETLADGTWAVTASPALGSAGNYLSGVSCPSAGSCVAVGYYSDGGPYQALAETLVDGTWHVSTAPGRGGDGNYLSGVSCPSAGWCAAVGYHHDSAGHDQTLVEAMVSGAWQLVPSADMSGKDNVLAGVSCASVSYCVAVGYYNNGHADQTLAESMTGGRWSAMASRDRSVANNQLSSVTCPAPGSCVAAGFYSNGQVQRTLVQRLTGRSWKLGANTVDQGSGDNRLNAVSCPSETYCAAVGELATASTHQVLAGKFSAGSWKVTPAQGVDAPRDALGAVSCPAGGACTAVGSYIDGTGVARAVVETLGNGFWTVSSSSGQSPPGSQLAGVSCPVPGSCAAVGWYADLATAGVPHPLVETLANGTWAVAAIPGPGGGGAGGLTGVSCTSPASCVAVGWYKRAGRRQALVETLANGTWALTASPVASPTGGGLDAVSCISATSCVAVGQYSGVASARALVEVLSGTTWSVASSFDTRAPEDNVLAGVSCPASLACAA